MFSCLRDLYNTNVYIIIQEQEKRNDRKRTSFFPWETINKNMPVLVLGSIAASDKLTLIMNE